MNISQNDQERLIEKVRSGEISADEANVEKVRIQRVLLVTSRIPASARKALNDAVKNGRLGHVKKDGYKPEAYYHPSFDYLVPGERNKHAEETLRAAARVMT